MKIPKAIAKLLAALTVTFLLVGMLLPSGFTSVIMVQTEGDAAAMCHTAATPRTWVDWSTWNLDIMPDMKSTYSGPETGEGATWNWTQKDGDGSLRITHHAALPPCVVAFDLSFEGMDDPWHGQVHITAMGEGTQVDWAFFGDVGNNLLFRWMTVLMKGKMAADNEAAALGLAAAAPVIATPAPEPVDDLEQAPQDL
jgi:hypothetical protein